MVVEKHVTMRETVFAPNRKISKRMKKYSIILSKENMGTRPLIEEENKNTLMNVEDP